MFLSKSLLSLIVIPLSVVDASPLNRYSGKATLGFTKWTSGLGTGLTIPARDRARAQAMMNARRLGKRQESIFPVNSDMYYTAQVGVGKGEYTLIIDTGSSNTFVGANVNHPYQPGPSSRKTWNTVEVIYGSAYFVGTEWIDTVTLSSDLVIPEQSIGVTTSYNAAGFRDFDGIIGLGPVDLTINTMNSTDAVPTVLNNLKTQGTISEEVLGVFYAPTSANRTGQLTFGGYDSDLTTSPMNYVPLTTTSPSSQYWGINQSISYRNTTILATTAGIVDTGTTLILIASDAFSIYQNKTGATLDQNTDLLTISPDLYSKLEPLSFNIGGTTYNLAPDAQTWPRSLNGVIGGSADKIYLVISSIGSPTGQGFDFINGCAFLERFYSVYDTTNNRIGFATTDYTDKVANQ